MNLKHISLVKEDDHGFFVKDARDNSAFRVAKKGLRPETLNQIVQHFAKGGEVRRRSGLPTNEIKPGEVVMSPMDAIQAGLSALRPPPGEFIESQDQAAMLDDLERREKGINRPRATDDLVAQSIALERAGLAKDQGAQPAFSLAPQAPSEGASRILNLAKPTQALEPDPGPIPDVNMTPASGMTPVPPGGMPQPMPQAPSPMAPPPQPQGVGALGGADRAIADSAIAQGKSAQALADLSQRAADEQLAIQKDAEAKRQAIFTRWEGERQKNQAAADQLTNDIATSKVDPQSFWKTRNTDEKVAATLGIILGSLGQAFGGGENQALKLINDAIEKDIDAQKTNLGKSQSLLSAYVQRGHSIDESMKLARADALDALAGQTAMVASKYAGPEAQAKVGAMQAKFKEEAYKTREDLFAKRAHTQAELMTAQAHLAGAQGQGGGARVPATEAANIGGMRAAQGMLDTLMRVRKDKTNWASALMQYVPGTDAAKYRDAQDLAAQVVGKLLEEGKMTDSDRDFYRGLMPTGADSDSRAEQKVEIIKTLLTQKLGGQLQALGGAGYNTEGLAPRVPANKQLVTD